ncbi:MAG: DUF7373 family lipoprotein [Mycobacterium sp.]
MGLRRTDVDWRAQFRRSTALTALAAVVLAGCSRTVPGTADLAPAQPAATVDPGALKPGSYPTGPLPPLGNAESEEAGRLVEGRRMANYVVGPWQAEPGMTDSRRTGAIVIGQENQLGAILWPEVGGRSWPQPFIVAFSSERRRADPKGPTVLRNAVLRYATADAAAAAAQSMASAALTAPAVVNPVSPIAAEPVRSVPIPGHADLTGALATRRDGDRTVQELTVISAHGPYVLVQVAQSQDPDRDAVLTGRLLDLQAPLIDGFQPTDPSQLADVPLDPTGLMARTLPLKQGQGDSMSNATYDPAGALHLEDNPSQAAQAFTATGVDVVSISQTTVYRAGDPDGARRLAQSLGDATAQRPASQPAAAVPGLPASRCVRIDGEGGLVPRYSCIAAVDRFAFKAVAREENNAHQQMAAQYLIVAR